MYTYKQTLCNLIIPNSDFLRFSTHLNSQCTIQRMHACRQTDRQTYRQTDRHTYRQTDRHTYRQTDRHTYRQTDRQTDRQTILIRQTYRHTSVIYIFAYIFDQLFRCWREIKDSS